jgi:hypothetical protein
MPWKPLPHFSLLLVLPALYFTMTSREPAANDCSRDLKVYTDEAHGDRWSSLGGKLSFHEEGQEPFIRLSFLADPDYLRFDRDASLRARVDFTCLPSERPMAFRFEMRFSHSLEGSAELNDLMLLGDQTRMLSGAGVPTANAWVPVRIPVPHDSPAFDALHFGVGSAWAREREGESITFDLRRVVIERRQWVSHLADPATPAAPQWKNSDNPARPAAGGPIVITEGAPLFTVIDFPAGAGGSMRVLPPPGVSVDTWVADWLPVEQKTGVVQGRAIRLLPYRPGSHLPQQGEHPRRFWLRISATGAAQAGDVVLTYAGHRVTRPVEVLPVRIPRSQTRHLMYYQMNENWTGYAKYAGFYRNAPAHFEQLARLGFTGVHLAEEPKFQVADGRLTADFSQPGRYWQKWPLPLDTLVNAARTHGLQGPLVWEGLRIFARDDVWGSLQSPCNCGGGAALDGQERLLTLAAAAASGWKKTATRPYLSVADEPGVHSEEEVMQTENRLRQLRSHGYRTFLTTHARMHDSFHRLAPYLDINALHAEDVTAAAWRVPKRYGGELWLYNGGSFNVTPPGHDRFFAGVYGWVARAQGIAQWIYTRPSQLVDPLDLRQRLSADAQFYALPGHGDQPAATPGLLGLAAGITDRAILDHAEAQAQAHPELAQALAELRNKLKLPERHSEYTPAQIRQQANLPEIRENLLRLLAKGSPQ